MSLYTELTGDDTAGPFNLPTGFDPVSAQHILVHIGGAVQRLSSYNLDLSTNPATISFAKAVPDGQLIRIQKVQAAGGGSGQKLINIAHMLDGSDQKILTCSAHHQIAIAGLRLSNRTPDMDQAQVVLVECWIEDPGSTVKHHVIAPRTPVPVGSVLAGLGGNDKLSLLPGQSLYAKCSVGDGATLMVSGLQGDL